MTRHSDAVRLRHMLESARKAVAFTQGRTRADLDRDELLGLAVIRLLEVVGEAAKGVSGELRGNHANVDWKLIAGMRDRLIHGYFEVDLDIVWAVVKSDLPNLISVLEPLVAEAENLDK